MDVPTAEQGLLGLTFDPTGRRSTYYRTHRPDGTTVIEEWDLQGDGRLATGATNRRQLLVIDQPYPNHNGGDLVCRTRRDAVRGQWVTAAAPATPRAAARTLRPTSGRSCASIRPVVRRPYRSRRTTRTRQDGGKPQIWA